MNTESQHLRIAIVSDAAPERNGVGTYYRDLMEHLAPRVEQVSIICPQNGDAPVNHWLRFPLPGDATQRLGVPSPLQLYRRLRALKPDVVIIATPGPYGLMGAQFARRHAGRLVFGLHTHYEALSGLYWGSVLAGVNRWYLSSINRRLVRQSHHVVANAPAMCELALKMGATRTSLVGTLLPVAFLEHPAPPLGEHLEQVLFVGRLAAEKRVNTIIEAARRHPAMRFRIAGDGPQRRSVEAAADQLPNLQYLGWQNRDGVRRALDESDLLVLPSQVEAFGTVALEALARGRLTLVSSGCGISQWPELGQCLDRISDNEQPADALARIAEEPAQQRQARADRARAAARASVEAALQAWLQVLAGPTAASNESAA